MPDKHEVIREDVWDRMTDKPDIVASIDSDVVLENNWLEIMLGLIDKNDTALYGGKMIEKFTQNKFNSWRAKYYSQNWGQEDMDNPPFIFGTLLVPNLCFFLANFANFIAFPLGSQNFSKML